MKKYLIIFILFSTINAQSQDSIFIKVHFLYGSRPAKSLSDQEEKWFGGIYGGHVGIEIGPDSILNFLPKDQFHLISKDEKRHSQFLVHTENQFWSIFGSMADSVKKLSIIIPISANQKSILDSISKVYEKNTPYDYAFLGMRCAAATYEILSQAGIVKKYSLRKASKKYFYPKKLRKYLINKALRNNWNIVRQEGSVRRIWEED